MSDTRDDASEPSPADAGIVRAYRESSVEEPPAALDAAVLAMARRETGRRARRPAG